MDTITFNYPADALPQSVDGDLLGTTVLGTTARIVAVERTGGALGMAEITAEATDDLRAMLDLGGLPFRVTTTYPEPPR